MSVSRAVYGQGVANSWSPVPPRASTALTVNILFLYGMPRRDGTCVFSCSHVKNQAATILDSFLAETDDKSQYTQVNVLDQ